ncbi:alpha-amylase family glycosyl hydrolase, partial [Winogradskyella sp.]|uniref:alpha-amylase family glycosyl hydrolase n=1 Tax=Winogradskyella sp. TaxID=1883156 RepID=UPI00260C3E48
KSWNDSIKGTTFDYEGWFGVKSLPELREDSTGIVEGPKKYIFNATRRWMNPKDKGTEFGIDGWRLDVAFCIGHPFWKKWRKYVRSINEEAYLTAEIVDTPEKVVPYMQGDEFDGEMNYNFAFASAEYFFNPEPYKISTSEYDAKLKELRELYPLQVAYVSQTLFGSHDVNRIGSYIVNRGIGNFRDWSSYARISKAIENPAYSSRKPKAEDIELLKLSIIMQMTYVGAPMIYYGDEVGMWGANDPDCRKPMLWDDIVYEDEVYGADETLHEPDKVEINTSLFDHYRQLIKIRNENEALQLGTYKTLLTDDDNAVFAFQRSYKNDDIIVVINNSDTSQTVELTELNGQCFKDLLTSNVYKADDKKTIKPKWGLILVACK